MTQTKAELLQTRHQGDIRLGDADSTHYVGFKAPATVSSSLVWTLPAADGTANYLLKTDGSGNLGWVADSSTDSTKMPLAGGTFTGNTIYNDNVKAIFGTSSDGLEIFHNGSTSTIKDSGTGNLNFQGSHFDFINAAGNEYVARFYNDGACELYHNNDLRLQTWSDGVNILGDEGEDARLHLYADNGDNNADKWRFSATAAGSFNLANYSTGSWVNGITLDGSNNATFAGTVQVDDYVSGSNTKWFAVGSSGDCKWYHDGSNTHLNESGTGSLIINASEVQLRQGGNVKLQTTADGVTATGTVTTGGIDIDGQYQQAVDAITPATTPTVNCALGNFFTLDATSTYPSSGWSFTNVPASCVYSLIIKVTTGGSTTINWNSIAVNGGSASNKIKWNGGAVPAFTAGSPLYIILTTTDTGATWEGTSLIDFATV